MRTYQSVSLKRKVTVPDDEPYADRLCTLRGELFMAVEALVNRLESITTEDFALGAEKAEREAVKALIAEIKGN